DLGHAAIGIVDRLALAQQSLRHILQAEGGKAPHRRTQGLDAVDHDAAGCRREEIPALYAMFAPIDRPPLASDRQRDTQFVGMFLQDAQIELDDAPADDHIRIMHLEPLRQLLQHVLAIGAIIELEIEFDLGPVCWPQHIDLTLPAALESDRIELAAKTGLDI